MQKSRKTTPGSCWRAGKRSSRNESIFYCRPEPDENSTILNLIKLPSENDCGSFRLADCVTCLQLPVVVLCLRPLCVCTWVTLVWYQCILSLTFLARNQMAEGFLSVNWCMDECSDIFCEALRLCCHAYMHPSMEFGVMRTQIHDVCGVAWNHGNLCGGRSSACKADRSTVRQRSVTKWNAWYCRDCEHRLGLMIGLWLVQVNTGRLVSRNEVTIWRVKKPFVLGTMVSSRRWWSCLGDWKHHREVDCVSANSLAGKACWVVACRVAYISGSFL